MANLFLYNHKFDRCRKVVILSVTQFKKDLFAEVRTYDKDSENKDDEALNKYMFHRADGLRLSLSGFLIIKKHFTAYSFALPDVLKSRHQMSLAKMEFPYALYRKRLILFSDMDAMLIKVHGGVLGFLETYSQIDK